MAGLFVTGTDTGVGKTVVTCAITAALVRRGIRVGVCKPVETGCRVQGGERVGEDCVRLAAAGGGTQKACDVASYLFVEPAAPFVAAQVEGAVIDPARMLADYRRIAAGFDFVMVEGAGGLLVPLTEHYMNRELARDLGLPVVCVVASRLGCLNHALLTMDAIAAAGLTLAGYVMNQIAESDEYLVASKTNAAILAQVSSATQLGSLPRLAAASPGAGMLADFAEAHLNLDTLLAAGRTSTSAKANDR